MAKLHAIAAAAGLTAEAAATELAKPAPGRRELAAEIEQPTAGAVSPSEPAPPTRAPAAAAAVVPHAADAEAISRAAIEFQAQMAASGWRISVAEAVVQVSAAAERQKASVPMSKAPTQADITTFYGKLSTTWNTTPELRKTFANFPAYQSAMEADYCRSHCLGIEELRGEMNVDEAFLREMTSSGRPPTDAAVALVRSAHTSWKASPDLRREFVSFRSYASHILVKGQR